MYRIEDITSATKEIQRLLGINTTGNYDKKTRDEVLRIQTLHAIEQSGEVDYKTFTLIVDEHLSRENAIWNSDYLLAADFPYSEGDIGENVLRINEALSRVLVTYPYYGEMPRGKYFGSSTLSGVKFLQAVFGMEESEEIDEYFMNRILAELEGIEIKEKYGYK
jgi:hypothetical protein